MFISMTAAPSDSSKQPWRLGEILVQKGWVRWQELENALSLQHEAPKKRIGEILVEKGVINSDTLYQALAIQFGLQFIHLGDISIEPAAIKMVPKHFVYEHQVIPLAVEKQKDILAVAVADPVNVWPLSMLEKIANVKEVRPILTTPQDIRAAIQKEYGPENEF